jgi:hypothetical protein
MTNTTKLNCFLLCGEVFFDINVTKNSSANDLKNSIKAALSPALNDIPAAFLTLWKVSIAAEDDSALRAFVPLNDEVKGVLLMKPFATLETIFATEPAQGHVHVIVQRPPRATYVWVALSHYLTLTPLPATQKTRLAVVILSMVT